MLITRIERQRNKPRYSIYLDGEPALDIHSETLLKSGLRRNDVLDENTIQRVKLEDLFQTAKQRALHFLSYRPRSEREIRDKLKNEKFEENIIVRVVENLKQNRLINDLEFGKMFARDSMMRKPLGKMVMKQKLFQKGIQRDAIEKILQEIYDEQDEHGIALALAEKRLPRLKNLDEIKQKQRISSYLAGRGFNWETIHNVIERMF